MDGMVELDGARGEGGGQILRTALALSLATGRSFRLENIRHGREKPGLLRQHATAVRAAVSVGDARAEGGEVGSRTLVFRPGRVRGGDYTFAVGSAGSATLVLQTVLPALWAADAPSRLTLEGGTHNPFAPPFDFLDRVYAPALRRMGVDAEFALERHGFYPAGGGRFTAVVRPTGRPPAPVSLMRTGRARRAVVEVRVAHLPESVAWREIRTLRRLLAAFRPEPEYLTTTVESAGPGNVALLTVEYDESTELSAAFGMRGVSAERVGHILADERRAFGDATAFARAAGDDESLLDGRAVSPVGPYLADQLLLPMALAGGGNFLTGEPTLHARTQAEVIGEFLPVRVEWIDHGRDGRRCLEARVVKA